MPEDREQTPWVKNPAPEPEKDVRDTHTKPMENLIHEARKTNEKLAAERSVSNLFRKPETVTTQANVPSVADILKEPSGDIEQAKDAQTLAVEFSSLVSSRVPDWLAQIAVVLKNSGADSMSQIKALNQIRDILIEN